MKQSRNARTESDSASVSIAAAKESCGAARFKSTTSLFFDYLLPAALSASSPYSFRQLDTPSSPILSLQTTPATPSLRAIDQITSHHGRQRHPGLRPSAGCSADHAIECRSHTKGPGTRVPRTIPEICMRHHIAHAIQQDPTNDNRTKHGIQPS